MPLSHKAVVQQAARTGVLFEALEQGNAQHYPMELVLGVCDLHTRNLPGLDQHHQDPTHTPVPFPRAQAKLFVSLS